MTDTLKIVIISMTGNMSKIALTITASILMMSGGIIWVAIKHYGFIHPMTLITVGFIIFIVCFIYSEYIELWKNKNRRKENAKTKR